ncbi:MAG: glycosyltransferase [Verrucomicrobiota bacterium]|nr:glycosyltransferase [Verrucomicrobiota bacterium]
MISKRLLYVCEADHGGIAEYAISQVMALNALGIEVRLLCRPSLDVSRLRAVQISALLPTGIERVRTLPGRCWAHLRDTLAMARIVEEETHRGAFGHVLFACYKEYFAPLWTSRLRAMRNQGIVFGTIAHDPIRDFVVGPQFWHRASVRAGYSFVTHVYVHDNTSVDFGGPQPAGIQVHQIPHGPLPTAPQVAGREVARNKYGLKADDIMFLAFGQIRDGKNLDRFLTVLQSLPPAVKLLVAGPCESTSQQRSPEDYRTLAERLGVSGRCRWDIRYIPAEEVADIFAASDYVLLSYSAKFRSASGIMNLAVTARKPMLASSGPGPLRESVEKYSLGVFVPPDDDAELLSGALRLLTANIAPEWTRYEHENSWEMNARLVASTIFN